MKTLQRVTLWVASTYFYPHLPKELILESIDRIFRQWHNLSSRGKVATAETFKNQRLAVTRFLSKEPLRIAGISQDKHFLPKVLPCGLRMLIVEGNPWAIRWALSLLSLSRVILGGKAIDFTTITDHPTKDITNVISDIEIVRFWQSIGRPKAPYKWTKFHWSTKSGPNGPGLQGALADLKCLTTSQIENLKTFFPADAPLWRLLNSISSPLFYLCLQYFKILPKRNRKLSVKNDKEGKSRIFAILDYWSQSSLVSLHKSLFKILKSLPGDCTFNQTRLTTSFAKRYLRTSDKYYSFDLRSATDRFPIEIQERLLRLLTSVKVSKAWRNIMVDEPFSHNGRLYKYNTGQPMGAYSSWALFTLSHHMIVYIAGIRNNLSNKAIRNQYMILGDDIVIHSDAIAKTYVEIIESLGVTISKQKTHTSNDSFEFAKRWFSKGIEVSPFPIAGIIQTMSSWPQLVELLSNEVPSRGYDHIRDLSAPLDNLSLIYSYPRLGQQVLKRIKIYLSLPCWYSEEGRAIDSLMSLLELAKSKVSWHPSHVLEYVTKVANLIVRKEVGSSVQKVSSQLSDLYDLVEKITPLEPVRESRNLSTSTFGIDDIPMVSVVKSLADSGLQVMGSVSLGRNIPHWSDLWTRWKDIEINTLPKFNGIIPLRAKELKSGSQAHLALKVAQMFTTHSREDIDEALEDFNRPKRRRKDPRLLLNSILADMNRKSSATSG